MTTPAETEVIRNIIATVLEVEPGLILGPVNFVTDLGADSLRVIEILARLETELKVRIGQDMLGRMASLDSVIDVVEESRTGQPGAQP